MHRKTGSVLVYAGSIGLATTFLVCVYLHDVLRLVRGWHCGGGHCNVPASWTIEQTRDVLLLWLGGLRSVLQIRAGLHLQQDEHARGPLAMYLVVAALDFVLLAAFGELPNVVLGLVGCWPLFVFALTRSQAGLEPLPRARVV